MKIAAPHSFPGTTHNHSACIETAVERARSICVQQGLRFTPLRERVFREVLSNHCPVGAYDLIERVAATGGPKLAPISVYRIIDVLMAAGLIHRLESRNAFFACNADHDAAEPSIVMLCDDCGRVGETMAGEAWHAVVAAGMRQSFKAREGLLEVKGQCADCSS